MKPIAVKFDEEEIQTIDIMALRLKINRSELIRYAVKFYISYLKGEIDCVKTPLGEMSVREQKT